MAAPTQDTALLHIQGIRAPPVASLRLADVRTPFINV